MTQDEKAELIALRMLVRAALKELAENSDMGAAWARAIMRRAHRAVEDAAEDGNSFIQVLADRALPAMRQLLTNIVPETIAEADGERDVPPLD